MQMYIAQPRGQPDQSAFAAIDWRLQSVGNIHMYKVIVERPRRRKDGDANAKRLRDAWDGPTRLGTRAGYGHRNLNENLAPLRRYLHAQVGRPWNKAFSGICAGIDRRNTVQQHIHQHVRDFIEHVLTEPRYDVVLRRNVSRVVEADTQRCTYLYGSGDLYAVSKRQISTREIKVHQLR